MGVFKDRENYLKQLCIAHALVAHTSTVNGVLRNSFFRTNNDEEILTATLKNISYPCVGYNSIQGRITDLDNALLDIRHIFKNSWIFIMHLDWITTDGTGYTDKIQDCFDITFGIMEDFIASMKNDFELSGHCGAFENFDLNKINYVQIGPVLQNEYGWELFFEDEILADNIIYGGDVPTDPCGPNKTEIIYIIDESYKTVVYTDQRRAWFGDFPEVECWLVDGTGVYYKAAVQPVVDAPPPDFTTLYWDFGSPVNGFIILK